jgi:hypothetical protein
LSSLEAGDLSLWNQEMGWIWYEWRQ